MVMNPENEVLPAAILEKYLTGLEWQASLRLTSPESWHRGLLFLGELLTRFALCKLSGKRQGVEKAGWITSFCALSYLWFLNVLECGIQLTEPTVENATNAVCSQVLAALSWKAVCRSTNKEHQIPIRLI